MTAPKPQPVEVNPHIIELEYAVRGPIPIRAAALKQQGRRIIPCNIGNPQALGQRPLTYYRQVLGLLEDPAAIGRERRLKQLLTDAHTDTVPDDVLELAETLLAALPTGLGAYSESKGPAFIREAIARYIDERDDVASTGAPRAEPEQIFLTNGASEGATRMIELLITNERDGIMIPIPQYPLYSATIRRCGGVQVDYYPDEDAGWTLDLSMLEESLATAEKEGVTVKGIVVINPGNPTGAVMDLDTIRATIDFAREHRILIIADEVYQENVYGAEFASFARMLGDDASVPLVSLHSISKGFYGECGHRGGYMELRNPPAVAGTDKNLVDLVLKMASVSLCPNTVGQLLTYLMVTPPEAGTATHALFVEERARILDDLHQKATMIRQAFSQMDSVECFGRTGAMYLFPRLNKLPAGASDFDYCSDLLDATGLVTVNGSGFGQRPGTHHLRVAFLPPKETLEEVLPEWIAFHNKYVNR